MCYVNILPDEGWGNRLFKLRPQQKDRIMKKFIAMTLLAATLTLAAAPAFAGPCDHPDDRAADGSRCGDRSADSREGGRGRR